MLRSQVTTVVQIMPMINVADNAADCLKKMTMLVLEKAQLMR